MEILGFGDSLPIFWLAAAIIFAVVEGLTMGLATIWFAAGALAALVSALLGAGLWVQIALFFAVSLLLIVFARGIFVKKLGTGREKTNVSALIGKEGSVIKGIPPYGAGLVKAGGQEWTAVTESGEVAVKCGEIVEIVGIEGVKLIVRPRKEQRR